MEAVSEYSLSVNTFDAVIVGAGGAGLRPRSSFPKPASRLPCCRRFSRPVRTPLRRRAASASLGNSEEDHWHWHMYDTVKGSDWLGDQDAIEFMCRKAPEVVVELEHYGMPSTVPTTARSTSVRSAATCRTSARSRCRACAAADRTGHAMLHALYQRNVRAQTQFFVEWMALDLIRDDDGQVLGVIAMKWKPARSSPSTPRPPSSRPAVPAASSTPRPTPSSTPVTASAWRRVPASARGHGVLAVPPDRRGRRGRADHRRRPWRRRHPAQLGGERFMERYAPNARIWPRATSSRVPWSPKSMKVAAAVRTRTHVRSTSRTCRRRPS